MPAAAHIRPEFISSPKNPFLRDIRRATMRGELMEDGCCVAESFHLLEEAIRSDVRIRAVLAAESVRSAVESHVGGLHSAPRVITVADSAFAEVTTTEASQGVITLVEPPKWTVDHLFRARSMVVVLDGVQDPGNAGAIVRAAEAFGATGALFLKGTVSPFNAKTLRGSAGSLFRLPFLAGMDSGLALAAIKQKNLDLYAAQPRAEMLVGDAPLSRRFALIIGSEGRGVSPEWETAAVGLRIPTVNVESLNAATAAAIVFYEAARQRTRP